MRSTYDGSGTKSPLWRLSRYGASDRSRALAAPLEVVQK